MIKHKLITARTEKGFSQQEIADLLFMDQSQYSRREKGITRITEEEWDKLASILEKQVEDIYEEESHVTIHNDNGSYGSVTTNIYNIPDFMLQSQQEYIEMLKNEIARLKEDIENLK